MNQMRSRAKAALYAAAGLAFLVLATAPRVRTY